jgi:GTP-binding protein
MKELKAELIVSAETFEQFPKINLPEFAFSGRSNVGKSSLLNSLVLRKELAYTSAKPGKTKQINFYIVENKYIFADLPGFGYATASKEQRERWTLLNTAYLTNRENLVLVVLLVDSRLEPQKLDLAQIELLESNAREYVLVLTKSDKVSKDLLNKRIKQFEFILQYCTSNVEILPYSSVTRQGREQLLALIRKYSQKVKKS